MSERSDEGGIGARVGRVEDVNGLCLWFCAPGICTFDVLMFVLIMLLI